MDIPTRLKIIDRQLVSLRESHRLITEGIEELEEERRQLCGSTGTGEPQGLPRHHWDVV